jgi:hypothetical protein
MLPFAPARERQAGRGVLLSGMFIREKLCCEGSRGYEKGIVRRIGDGKTGRAKVSGVYPRNIKIIFFEIDHTGQKQCAGEVMLRSRHVP